MPEDVPTAREKKQTPSQIENTEVHTPNGISESQFERICVMFFHSCFLIACKYSLSLYATIYTPEHILFSHFVHITNQANAYIWIATGESLRL